jgi:iron complex transport system substrate-binding protein
MRKGLRWDVGLASVAVVSLLAMPATAGFAGAPAIAAAQDRAGSPTDSAVVLTDDAGRRASLSHAPRRIISLAPGATEMLFAAGLGDRVVATVEYSDEPPAAKQVPRIGDVTAVDIERLVAMHPDLVVVWPGGGNPAQIEKIARLGIPVYRQQVNRLADLPASLRRLGALASDRSVADRAARNLEELLARLANGYGGGEHPTVLLEVWNRPIYTVGGTHLMSDALTLCGGRNVFGDLKELGPVISTEAVIARNPDIIVAVAPPGEGKSWVEEWQRFGSLNAVRSGRLISFEDQRFVRLGPSVVSATEGLCKALAAAEDRSPRPR